MRTFREFARACCMQLGQWGYSTETVHVYDRTYHQFMAFLKAQGAHDDVRSFNDRLVFGFAEDLGRRSIHPNTIIKALSALSTLARYGGMADDAEGKRWLTGADPTKSFRWPTAQQHETKWAFPDEIRALIDLPAPIHKAIARDILVETGIRVGEACRLNVQHFRNDGERYFLSVSTKGRGQQRRQATRDVPLSKGLGDALRDWLLLRKEASDPESPLLVNGDGKRWKRAVLSNMVARLAAAAGITRLRLSAHKLRHSKNVRDRKAGIDAVVRARLNGHTSLRSQERYDHIEPDELHSASDESLGQLQEWLGKPFRATPESGPQNQKYDGVSNAVNDSLDEDLRAYD